MKDGRNEEFQRCFAYILDNLDGDLRLPALARGAGVSVSTLKRAFRDTLGCAPGRAIRELRMEGALRALKATDRTVLDCALAAGYQDPSAFSRSFRRTLHAAPKAAIRRGTVIDYLNKKTLDEPAVVHWPGAELQAVTATGRYFECAPLAWHRLRETVGAAATEGRLLFGIGWSNPHEGELNKSIVRYSAGIFGAPPSAALEPVSLAAGRYARFAYRGRPAKIGEAFHHIFTTWARRSGETVLVNQPTFCRYDDFPEAHRPAMVSIFVPLKGGSK